MKKKNLFLVMAWILCITLSLSSCISLLNTVATGNVTGNATGNTGWSMGYFTNEWGEKTDAYFLHYNNNVGGVFSNSVVQNAPVTVREITFSEEEGLTFDLHDRNDSPFITRNMISSVNVIIRIGNTDEIFDARPSGIRTVRIDFSDKLLKTFQRQERMLFRITANSRSDLLTSYYQFEFSPMRFNEAYENLGNMISK
jgi:hypothetical protein